MAKNVGKFRKNRIYDEDQEWESGYLYTSRKKKDISEVKRVKNKTISRMKYPTYEETMNMSKEDDWFY